MEAATIDTTKKAPRGDLVIHQMDAGAKKHDAEKWIDSPEGQAWSEGQPVQLLQVKVDGR